MNRYYLVETLGERPERGARPITYSKAFPFAADAAAHFAARVASLPCGEHCLDAKEGSARLNVATYHGERLV
jgi:hypothetical protein